MDLYNNYSKKAAIKTARCFASFYDDSTGAHCLVSHLHTNPPAPRKRLRLRPRLAVGDHTSQQLLLEGVFTMPTCCLT